jgi:hypothetical protein
MVKYFFWFALIVNCTNTELNAQKKFSASKLKYGLKTGLSLSSFTKDVGVFAPWTPGVPVSNYGGYEKYFRISSLFGVVAEYPLTSTFSIGTELLYAGRGAAYRKENSDVVTITDQGAEKAYDYYKFKIGYLELPLTANWNLSSNSNGKTAFSLYAGLAPAFAISHGTSYHSYETSSGSPVASSTVKEGELKYVRAFNLSTVAGFKIGGKDEGSVFVDARISNTLLPVFKYATTDEGYNLNTAMWTATLGIGIHLK